MEKKEKIKNKQNRKNKKFIIIVLLIVFAALIIWAGSFFVSAMSDIKGTNQLDKQVTINIPEGSTGSDVAKILKDNGIIQNTSVYRIYSKLTGGGGQFRAGEHVLNANMSFDKIFEELKKGGAQDPSVKITFPEGYNAWDIAQKLEENDICSAEDFITTLETYDFDYDFVKEIPQNELRYLKLEGYLFPDTYDFYLGEKPEKVIMRFLDNFDAKFTPELRQKAKDIGLSIDKAVTLASIIQAESSDPATMGEVSSVFNNRLKNGSTLPKLQSCVTRDYANNIIKQRVEKESQPLMDAYNTYTCPGLPAGPICSPGAEALSAAVNPKDTPYYYFCSDVNGKFYFAVTLNDHNKNVDFSRSVPKEK